MCLRFRKNNCFSQLRCYSREHLKLQEKEQTLNHIFLAISYQRLLSKLFETAISLKQLYNICNLTFCLFKNIAGGHCLNLCCNKSIFCLFDIFFTLLNLLSKELSAFFLETNISKNMGNLTGRGYILML